MDEIFDFSMLETIPDADAEIVVPDEVLEGPQTEEEQGVANLILDAISNSANTIQMYNAIIANCTDEEIVDSLNEILVDENRIMGKLQSILQKVSPNAEEIMNGAIEDSGIEESTSYDDVGNLVEMKRDRFMGRRERPLKEARRLSEGVASATDVTRGLYHNFTKLELISERDLSYNQVGLMFDGVSKVDQKSLINYLDKLGVWYKIKGNTLLVKADEDSDLDESLILDESNNLDTALDDVTPVRDVHNERAIRDHKKSRELRKNAMKEISKNVKDVFELDESLNL